MDIPDKLYYFYIALLLLIVVIAIGYQISVPVPRQERVVPQVIETHNIRLYLRP